MDDKNKRPAGQDNDLSESLETTSTTARSTGATTSPATAKPAGPESKSTLWNKIRNHFSIYYWAFILMVILAAVAIFIVYRWQTKPATKNPRSSSLTSEQLSQLQGNTTLVGDSKQTLDIQSNSVFEGQVLIRSDLSVAGGVKIGGALSLPSLAVSGSSSFGQLQVNDTLAVAGAVTLQSQLNLQKNLVVAGAASFGGTVSAATLNVSNLQLSGDIAVNRHITIGGSTPGKSNGGALGSGGSASVSGGDTGGTVTINTGGGPPAGCFVSINFAQKFNVTPHVIISPSNSAAAGLNYYTNRSSTSFSICTTNAPAASTTYLFDYLVLG